MLRLSIMKVSEVKFTAVSILFLASPAFADTFGTGGNQFNIDFATIGNAGNTADNTTYGAVGYTYRMGVYEVSRDMITKYNAIGAGPAITLQDMASFGGNGAARPATGVSWNEAARFVNYLNTSSGYSAAYQFDTGGANDNIALWEVGDSGYNAANPFRNSNAHYFLPSEDEWYKAAYYDPNKSGGAGYWDYATGSDTAPTAVASGTSGGTAVYGQSFGNGPADITNAGGLSAYGTMAQNGNVREWGESGVTAPNDLAGESRLLRGGGWSNSSGSLASSFRNTNSPTFELNTVGFRVAAVPEPSAFFLTLISAVCLVIRRKR
jgi:hypothetical protein